MPEGLNLDLKNQSLKLDVRRPEFYVNPYPTYRALQEKCPVVYWEDYAVWTFFKHTDIDRILKDRRFGRSLDGIPLTHDENPALRVQPFFDADRFSLLNLEPPEHSRLRSLVQKAFMSRQVERLRPRIESLANELCDQIESLIRKEGSVDFKREFASPIPVMIIAEMLGVPSEHCQQLLNWSHAMVRMYEPTRTLKIEEDAGTAASEFMSLLSNLLDAKRRSPADDLISHLLQVKVNEDVLTDHEIISTCILLLNAGHEATVNVLGNGLVALLQKKDQLHLWQEALGDPSFTGRAVEELLRFDTPLHIFNRYVLEDVEIGKRLLRKGDQVSLVLGSGNRDSDIFLRPDELDLTREKNPHLSFGRGIHFCIGAPLARLELQVALPVLLSRFREMELLEEPPVTNTYHFRGRQEIWIKHSNI